MSWGRSLASRRQKCYLDLASTFWWLTSVLPWSQCYDLLSYVAISLFITWRNIIDLDQAGLRCSTGIGSWDDSVSSLHHRSDSTGSCTRPGRPPLRRWHSDLRLLSAWWLFPAPKPCFWLHKRRGQVVTIQPTSTQHLQDWGDLVHFATSPASDSFCSVRLWHRCRCTCLFSSRSRHLFRLGRMFPWRYRHSLQRCARSKAYVGRSLS